MKLSIVVATNRGTFWQQFCESLSKNAVEMEVIFVGPVGDGAEGLPVPVTFLNTGASPLGAARSWELGARAATGELLGFAADDVTFTPGFLDAVAAEASKPHNPHDMFTARYFCNDVDETKAQHIWSIGTMPLLPIGGFSYTETHHRIGGIDKRFHGVYWDCDLYMHLCQLGGQTTMLSEYVCHERNTEHGLWGSNHVEDGKVLHELWPGPYVPEMQRSDPERQRMEDW